MEDVTESVRLTKQIEQLQNQRKDIERKAKKEERKAEAHAKITIGGMILSKLGLNWKEVNFEKLAKAISRCNLIDPETFSCEELELANAKKRLRNWEFYRHPWESWQDDYLDQKPGA